MRSLRSLLLLTSLASTACEEARRPAPDASTVGIAVEVLPSSLNPTTATTATDAVGRVQPTEPGASPPEWVNKGSSFTDESGVQFGVGMVRGIKNPSLARSTAENRARAEIAKVVGTKTEVVEAQGGTKLRTFSAALSGVEIVEHWEDPKTGATYALARLPN